MIIIVISVFLSISIIIESIGSWFRYIGVINSEPTNGYSTHVRVATISRLFIVLAAPMIGYIVDAGGSINHLCLMGFIVFSFTAIFLYLNKSPNYFLFKSYNYLNKNIYINNYNIYKNLKFVGFSKFQISSLISYIFTASGILMVNIFAVNYLEFRATIIQMAAFITMFGTLIHIFYVDPELARAADVSSVETYKLVSEFILGRFWGSVLLSVFFLISYLVIEV